MSGESYVKKSLIFKALFSFFFFFKLTFNVNRLKVEKTVGILIRDLMLQEVEWLPKGKWPLISRRQHELREKMRGLRAGQQNINHKKKKKRGVTEMKDESMTMAAWTLGVTGSCWASNAAKMNYRESGLHKTKR